MQRRSSKVIECGVLSPAAHGLIGTQGLGCDPRHPTLTRAAKRLMPTASAAEIRALHRIAAAVGCNAVPHSKRSPVGN